MPVSFRAFCESPEDYRGQHRAPQSDEGAPLWDVTGGTYPESRVYPADVYGPRGLQYYGTGDPAIDSPSYRLILSYKGHPNRPLTIYRAVPKDVPSAEARIRPGDWVTPLRGYATSHGRSALNGDYRLVTKSVYARDLFTDGNSWAEWGYDPQPFVPVAQEKVIRQRMAAPLP